MRVILRRLKETPYELPTALLAFIYALVTLFGPAETTNSLERFVPGWLVVMWCIALALGGALTIVGRVQDWLRTELAGQMVLCYGIGLYTVGLLIAARPAAIFAAFVYASYTVGAAARAHTLRQSLKAREVAQSIVDRKEQ